MWIVLELIPWLLIIFAAFRAKAKLAGLELSKPRLVLFWFFTIGVPAFLQQVAVYVFAPPSEITRLHSFLTEWGVDADPVVDALWRSVGAIAGIIIVRAASPLTLKKWSPVQPLKPLLLRMLPTRAVVAQLSRSMIALFSKKRRMLVVSVAAIAILVALFIRWPQSSSSRGVWAKRAVAVIDAVKPSPSLTIRKAVYGYLPDGPAVDVTEKVRSLVKSGALSVSASAINFADRSNGTRSLTVTKAVIKFRYAYPADITDTVKGFQTGNSLHTTGNSGGDATITVYYNYGDGVQRSAESGPDGSLDIDPPTSLRTDYTFSGVDGCKIVTQGHTLEINDKIDTGTDKLKPFLGRWRASWGDVNEDVTVEQNTEGEPLVTVSGSTVSGVKLECGNLSYTRTVMSSRYRFVDTVSLGSDGLLELIVFRVDGGMTFNGKLTRQ